MQSVPGEQNNEKTTQLHKASILLHVPWLLPLKRGDPWPHLSPLHYQIPNSGKICLSDYNSDTQEAREEKT